MIYIISAKTSLHNCVIYERLVVRTVDYFIFHRIDLWPNIFECSTTRIKWCSLTYRSLEIALNQLFACLNPKLRSFIASSGDLLQDEEGYIHSDIDYAIVKRRSINFVYQDIGNNDNTVLLEELVIVGCYYTISRECLKYIVSGKLPHLKVLKLDLSLLGIIDERDESIWNQLKDYCESSSIEKCKIIIRNIFEDEILTLVLYNNEDDI